MGKKIVQLCVVGLLSFVSTALTFAADLVIGVQIPASAAVEADAWRPLEKAISAALKAQSVRLMPLADAFAIESEVRQHRVDFLLLDPYYYISQRDRLGLSRVLATLERRVNGQTLRSLSGAIVTSQMRTELKQIEDLRGKIILADSQGGLPGYAAQAYELYKAGFELDEIQSMVRRQPLVLNEAIQSLQQGQVDALFISADQLAALPENQALTVIHLQPLHGYPYPSSTVLYPDMPLVMLEHVDLRVARRLTTALLGVESQQLERTPLNMHGFTIPESYVTVDQVARDLRLPPYDAIPQFTLHDIWEKYAAWLLAIVMSFFIITVLVLKLLLSSRTLLRQKSDLHQQALALRNSENMLRGTLECSPNVAVQWIDEAGKISYWNKASKKIFGYSPIEVMGSSIYSLMFDEQNCAQFKKMVGLARVRGESEPVELRFTRPNGESGRVVSTVFSMYGERQQVIFVCMHVDVSERFAAERRLESERRHLLTLVKTIPDLVWLKDLQGAYLACNGKVEELFGKTERELIGKTDYDFIDSVLADHFRVSDNTVAETGEAHLSEEWLSFSGNGQRTLFEVTKVPMRDVDGNIVGVLGIAHDITDQRSKEFIKQRDREQQAKLRELLEEVVLTSGDIEVKLNFFLKSFLGFSYFSEISRGGIYLLDEESGEMRLAAAYDLPPVVDRRCQVINLSECNCGDAMAAGKMRQMDCSSLAKKAPCLAMADMKVVSLPITTDCKTVGLILLYLPCGEEIDADAEQFFISVADILAAYLNRYRQDQALREREVLYRSVVETSCDGFWIVDMQGTVVEVNQAYCDLSGYTREEIVGQHISKFEVLESSDDTARHIENIIRDGSDLFETQHRRKNDDVWPVEISVSYWPEAGRYFFAYLRDISERKQVEKTLEENAQRLEQLVDQRTDELQQSKSQLELIIESLPAIFYIKDIDGRYLMVNQRYEALTGISKEAFVGATDEELFATPEQRDQFRMTKNSISTRETISSEEKRMFHDGRTRDLLITKVPLFDHDDQLYGIVSIAIDITEEKVLQHELERAMDNLSRRAALEHLVSTVTAELIGADPDSIEDEIESVLGRIGQFTNADRANFIVFDNDRERFGIVRQWCNSGVSETIDQYHQIPMERYPEMIQMLGIGMPLNFSVHDDSYGALAVREFATASRAKSALIIPVYHSGRLQAAIGLDALSETPGWAEDDLDMLQTQADLLGQILHGKFAREEILDAKNEAENLARVKAEFLANMSHEIRTPLNAVLGFAQMGVRTSHDRHDSDNFSRILRSGQHLLGLVNDILDFSKFEAGKFTLESVQYSLGEVIDNAVSFVADVAYDKKLDFRVQESPELPQMVQGDPMRVTQVLSNLLSNAIKFTQQGQIYLQVYTRGEELIFRVIDSGIGMTAEQLSRLFTPFEQADNSTTRRFGGSGLGLAISRRLIKAMSGSIVVDSEPHAGSTFEVHLPLLNPRYTDNDQQHLCEHLHCMGLDASLGDELHDQLQQFGGSLKVASSLDQIKDLQHGCLITSHTVLATQQEQIASCQQQGWNVVCVIYPGEAPPEGEGIYVVIYPVRLRHLLQLAEGKNDQLISAVKTQRLHGLKILAAEDNEINRIVLEDILLNEGAEVTFAQHGQEAIEILLASGFSFDVILMDIQMPVMDGYTATRKIKQINHGIPVIGLTAHAFVEEKKRCLEAGMADHVTKPIDVDTIVTSILRHVGGANQEQDKVTAVGVQAVSGEIGGRQVIDWDELSSKFSGRDEFVKKILLKSQEGYGQLAQQLAECIDNKNYEQLAFVAHSLKGSSGNICARSLFEIAKATEEQARQGEVAAFETALSLQQELEIIVGCIHEKYAEH